MPPLVREEQEDRGSVELLRAQLAMLTAKFDVLSLQMDNAIADMTMLVHHVCQASVRSAATSESRGGQPLESGSYALVAGIVRGQLRKAEHEEDVQVAPHAAGRVREAVPLVHLDLPVLAIAAVPLPV